MVPTSPLLIFLIYLLLQFFGLFIYKEGFFKIKEEFNLKSLRNSTLYANNSFLTPQINKSIIIIIDGLRFDFAFSIGKENKNFFENKLTILQELLTKENNRTILLPLYADPPTVTTQRVKSILTGNLACFIDFQDNFDGKEVEEDNILYQLKIQNRKTIFMGADMWGRLFPSMLSEIHAFDSYNSLDLDSVDEGITNKLYKYLEEDSWHHLICHFLGVDHVGHSYEPNHPEMTKKLKQMDSLLRHVIEKMDEETILFIMGDHGMTPDGNHGGATKEETHTVLFSYTKKGFNLKSENFIQKILISNKEMSEHVNQIDFVPTFAMLFGLPIPFNNLGKLIYDFIIPIHPSSLKYLLDISLLNLQQVKDNVISFQEKSKKLPEAKYEYYIKKITNLELKYQNYNDQYLDNDQVISFISEIQSTLSEVQIECRKVWTEYNLFLMFIGKIIMLLSLFSVLALCEYFSNLSSLSKTIQYKNINLRDYKISLLLISFFVPILLFIYELKIIEIFALIICGISIFFLYYIVCQIIKVRKYFAIQKGNILINNVFFDNLFAGAMFCIIQIGHGYMLNAVGHIRTEGNSTLNLLYLCSFLYFFKIFTTKTPIINAFVHLLMMIFSLYLSSYYDLNLHSTSDITLKKYLSTSNSSLLPEFFIGSSFFRIIIPTIFLLLLLHFLFQNIFKKEKKKKELRKEEKQLEKKIEEVEKDMSEDGGKMKENGSKMNIRMELENEIGRREDFEKRRKEEGEKLMKGKRITEEKIKKKNEEKRINLLIAFKYIQIGNMFLVGVYLYLKENILFDNMEKSKLIKIYLPRLCLVLMITSYILLILRQIKRKNASMTFTFLELYLLSLLPFIINLLLLLGNNAMIIFSLMLIFLFFHWKLMGTLQLSEHPQTAAFLAASALYFWYVFGNKPQIAALQVMNAYIGFETFNYYVCGILLILNSSGAFLIILLLIPFTLLPTSSSILFSFPLVSSSLTISSCNSSLHLLKIILFYLSFFGSAIANTSINCTYNRGALLLVEDFAPKFFFDSMIYIVNAFVGGGVVLVSWIYGF